MYQFHRVIFADISLWSFKNPLFSPPTPSSLSMVPSLARSRLQQNDCGTIIHTTPHNSTTLAYRQDEPRLHRGCQLFWGLGAWTLLLLNGLATELSGWQRFPARSRWRSKGVGNQGCCTCTEFATTVYSSHHHPSPLTNNDTTWPRARTADSSRLTKLIVGMIVNRLILRNYNLIWLISK